MKDVYLVRHGQAAPGPSGMDGDFHLTELGRQQAHDTGRELARRVGRVSAIYCSRLTRARETAETLGGHVGGSVTVRDELIEHGSGVFLLDCSLAEVARRHPGQIDAQGAVIYRPGDGPGINPQFSAAGETVAALHQRAGEAWQRILAAHPGPEECCMIVAHGSLLSAMTSEILGLPIRTIWSFQFANAGYLHLRVYACEATGNPVAAVVVHGGGAQQTFTRAERITQEQP